MSDHPATSIHAAVEAIPNREVIEIHPDRVALRWVRADSLRVFLSNRDLPPRALPHEALTFGELRALIGRTAQGLADLSIRFGDRVMVCLPMSLQYYVSVLALQRIGAIPVLVDPASPRLKLDACARAIQPRAMISSEQIFVFSAPLPGLSRLSLRISAGPVSRLYSARIEDLMRNETLAQPRLPDPEQVALITFHLTASGRQEAQCHTHEALTLLHRELDPLRPERGQGIDLALSPAHSLHHLASGISTIVPAYRRDGHSHESDARVLLAQLHSCGATCVTLSPSMLHQLLDYCRGAAPGWDRGGPSEREDLLLTHILVSGPPIHESDLFEIRRIAPHAGVKLLFESAEENNPMAYLFRRVS